jgi:hypothetical protein
MGQRGPEPRLSALFGDFQGGPLGVGEDRSYSLRETHRGIRSRAPGSSPGSAQGGAQVDTARPGWQDR